MVEEGQHDPEFETIVGKFFFFLVHFSIFPDVAKCKSYDIYKNKPNNNQFNNDLLMKTLLDVELFELHIRRNLDVYFDLLFLLLTLI